jgi:hypothetical protein
MRESRSQLIAEHVLLAISRSALTERTYAQTVADMYLARTPLHARSVSFAISADPYADSEANRQTVKRMLDGRVRMAVDVEEALILALPQPYRGRLLADLAERMGLLAAAQPQDTPAGQQQQIGELMQHMGDTVSRLSPMLDDGRMDAGDAAHAAAALAELDALQAIAVTLKSAIHQHVLGSTETQPLRSVK